MAEGPPVDPAPSPAPAVAPPPRVPPRPVGLRGRRPPWIVLVPALLVAAAVLIPLAYLLLRAGDAGGGVLGYLTRPSTLAIVGRSLLLVAGVTACSLFVALPTAWLTTRSDLPWRRAWFVISVLPLVIPSYVMAYAFVSAFAPGGLVTPYLAVDLPVYGFWGALYVLTLSTFPYMLLTLRAGFLGIDPSLEEAARSLGRGGFAGFRSVTLPLLRPQIAAGGLLVALYVLSDFGAVSMLRYSTFTRAIYVQYQNSFNRGDAAALGLVLVALTAAILLLDARVRGRGRVGRAGVGEARRAAPVPLGAWRVPATVFLAGVSGLALVGPIGVILVWLGRGVATGQALSLEWGTALGTAAVSLGAAGAAVVAAVPVAVLAVRFPSRLSALLERLTYLGYALPGIVVALALVFFGIRAAPWAYQTAAMLIFAYLLLFLPQAVGTLRAGLLAVNPHLEEASRSLGLGASRTLGRVTLPLLRPSMITGTMLVFLSTMKELPATLLLRPTGFDTLATRVWQWTTEAFFAQAAPFALLLVLVSSLSVGVLLSQEREI